MNDILVLNGPNLNLLGKREPSHYGSATLLEIEEQLKQTAQQTGYVLDCYQSNAEFQLIERIHLSLEQNTRFILMNPAAFTHTSIALRDALLGVKIPFIEIHLSNIHQRETFRHHSYFSDIAKGSIIGLGATGYQLALQAAIEHLKQQESNALTPQASSH